MSDDETSEPMRGATMDDATYLRETETRLSTVAQQPQSTYDRAMQDLDDALMTLEHSVHMVAQATEPIRTPRPEKIGEEARIEEASSQVVTQIRKAAERVRAMSRALYGLRDELDVYAADSEPTEQRVAR